ncbi:MAG: acyltransferase family protein [Lachnospiraceae bacterium]|nr:acyltransferase family protein [Lachnospiraceae bacterium]
MEEMNGQEKRIYYMDSCKGMLIVLMVAGHCLALYREDKICDVLYWLIYSFHMPVFIFVSGCFSKNLDKPLCKLFQELIVPMIPFELLYWVIHFGGGGNAYPFLTPIYAYWYMIVLFFCRAANQIAARIRGMLILSVSVGLLAGYNTYIGEYFTLSRFLYLFPFFFLGYRMKSGQLERIRKMKFWIPAAACLAAALLFCWLYEWTGGKLDVLYMKEPYQEAGDIVIRISQYLTSLLMILVLVRVMPGKKNILTRFGKATYLIYMLNFYFVEILSRLLPEGIAPGWNALVCFLYTFGAVLVMSSELSRKIFEKMRKGVERVIFAESFVSRL